MTFNRRSFLAAAACSGAAVAVGKPAVAPIVATARPVGTPPAGSRVLMPHRRVIGRGEAAMEVSSIGFGCMGMSFLRGTHPDRKTCIELIRHAVEQGVTLFDTAEAYGPFENEEIVGEALRPFHGEIPLTTKMGFTYEGTRYTGVSSDPKVLRAALENALRRFHTDCMDLVYIHRRDLTRPIEEVAETMLGFKKEGKLRRWGLSEVSGGTLRRANAVFPVTALQSEYSLTWREPETNGVFAACADLGVGLVNFGPIAKGFLGGFVNECTIYVDTPVDNRKTFPRYTPENIRKALPLLAALEEFGKSRGVTVPQLALAWCLAKAPWIVPIPGTCRLAHLEEDLRAASIALSADEVAALDALTLAHPVAGDRYPPSEDARVDREP